MEIAFLGNWSAKTLPGKANTSFVVDGEMAFDFGPESLQTMIDKGMDPNRLNTVFISHMHYDHFGGIIGLLWYRAMSGNENELLVLGPDGIEETTRNMLSNFLTPQGFKVYVSFDFSSLDNNVEVFTGDHTVPVNGYRVYHDNKVLFYSGDTAFTQSYVEGAEKADVIIHEMTYPDNLSIEASLWKHSTVSDTIRTFRESGAKRIIPVHLTEGTYKEIPVLQKKIEQLYMAEGTITL